MTELRMLSLAAAIAALVAYYSIQVYRFAVEPAQANKRSGHNDAGASLFDLRRGNRWLRKRRMAGERRPLLRPMQRGARHSSAAVAGARHQAPRRQRRGASMIELNDIEED